MNSPLNKKNSDMLWPARSKEAVADAQDACTLTPDSIEATHALARTLCLKNDLAAGCAIYREFLEKDGQDDPGCFNNLAALLYENGHVKDAIKTFSAAIKKHPVDWRIATNLALVLSVHEEIEDVATVLQYIIAEQPHDLALQYVTTVALDKIPYPAANFSLIETDIVQVLPFLRLCWEREGNVADAKIIDINDRSICLEILSGPSLTPVFYPGREVILGGLRRKSFVGLRTNVLTQSLSAGGQTIELLRPVGLQTPSRQDQYRIPLRNIIQAIFVASDDPLTKDEWDERDISASGMSFRSKRALAIGGRINIHLNIHGHAFDCEAVVVRCRPSSTKDFDVGIKFIHGQYGLHAQLVQAALHLRLEGESGIK